MPRENKLEEEYKEIKKEEIDKEKKDIKKKIDKRKKLLLKLRLIKFRNDIIYIALLTIILGFILWAWKPQWFGYFRSLALGFAWYLLFEELHLHKMFKKE